MTEYIIEPTGGFNKLHTEDGEPDEYYGIMHEEIVRCKDCEYRYDSQCGRYPDWFDIELDGFCAWGEHK